MNKFGLNKIKLQVFFMSMIKKIKKMMFSSLNEGFLKLNLSNAFVMFTHLFGKITHNR